MSIADSRDPKYPAVLKEAKVSTITNRRCNQWVREKKGNYTVTRNMICAVNPTDASCHGDSGGPLITLSQKGIYQQIGIISFGDEIVEREDLCPLKYPNFFSRVTAQLDWIKMMIKR